MTANPDYLSLAVALADHIHEHYYIETPLIGEPPIPLFDDNCSSSLQMPARALEKLGVVEPWKDSVRYHVFTCAPSEFREVISKNENRGCSFDGLVLCLILCARLRDGKETEVFRYLVALGLCEPEMREIEHDAVPGYRVYENGKPKMRKTIAWTPKKARYDVLYNSWPSLFG